MSVRSRCPLAPKMSKKRNFQEKGRAEFHEFDFREAYEQYLRKYHEEDIKQILYAENADDHYSIVIDFAEVLQASDHLAHSLHCYALEQLRWFDESAEKVQKEILDSGIPNTMSLKGRVGIRIGGEGSPMGCPEAHPSIGHVRVKDIGRLLTLSGTIIRCGAMKMLEGKRLYECAKCNYRFYAYPELESGSSMSMPLLCPSKRMNLGHSSKFLEIEDSRVKHDYQEIKIQEKVEALLIGSVPRSIMIVLEDDLVDTVRAGDDVIVTGVLYAKWRPCVKGSRCKLELMLHANYLRKSSEIRLPTEVSSEVIEEFKDFWANFKETPLEGRNNILRNICPQVYGLFTVKLAVTLTLIGGVQRIDASGTRVRGQSHLLLVGDPGTGKSQFLKYAAKMSTRSVLTTGLGSSNAGLTVTAVKDRGEWVLEAGALVLADGGLCCIDEFDSMREADRATMHEAMEQQTISVAKAGFLTTLNTRTTVFGVMNPKGQYDPYQSLSINTTLSSPLLSRFDIVLVLLDTKTQEWDEIVSSHILLEHSSPAEVGDVKNAKPWSLPVLKSYIEYVKTRFEPKLTVEAEKVLVAYYQLQRRSGEQTAARTTIRMLESLIRLAQAHARLMFRNEVIEVDAIAAVWCMEMSMSSCQLIDQGESRLHSTFTKHPDEKCILYFVRGGGGQYLCCRRRKVAAADAFSLLDAIDAKERQSILAKLQLSPNGGGQPE